MNRFLEFKMKLKIQIDLFAKDNLERNACDLAIEMGHQQMLDLL